MIFLVFYLTCLLADTNCLVVSGALNDEAEMRKARYGCTRIASRKFFFCFNL